MTADKRERPDGEGGTQGALRGMDAAQKAREARLRRMAQRQGLRLITRRNPYNLRRCRGCRWNRARPSLHAWASMSANSVSVLSRARLGLGMSEFN